MCFLLPAHKQITPSPSGCPLDSERIPSCTTAISAVEQMRWARSIARRVRRAFQFAVGSQEEEDLDATAYLTIVELAGRFDASKMPAGGDLVGAFRGWAAIEVKCRCQREARRLRNGGTYHTRREKSRESVVIERLQDGPDMIDPRTLPHEEDENEVDSSGT
jgi:hypothetical protein